MISREEALDLLRSRNSEENQIHHALETEAILRGLAERLGHDPELWGLCGLLHDLDFPTTRDEPEKHGLLAPEWLADKLPDDALQAIRAHNGELNGHPPAGPLDFALRCGETVTGLVAAAALVRPTRMEGMKPKSLKKKMKDKRFAAAVRRDVIRECNRIGLDLTEFLQLAIDAVTPIADQVGLGN